MVGKFLNLDDDDTPKPDVSIGAGLKKKPKTQRGRADTKAVAKAGEAHGFTRATQPQPARVKNPKLEPDTPRRGRPPLNEDMTYWRIYVAPMLRDELNRLRDKEGRRLNDLLQDMLDAYKAK